MTTKYKAYKHFLDPEKHEEFKRLLMYKEGKGVSEWIREQEDKYLKKNKENGKPAKFQTKGS